VLSVTPAVVTSISITPNPAFVGMGFQTQLTAIGTFSDATTANVTSVASWVSGASSVASVGPTTGLLSGILVGSTSINASLGQVSGSAPLSVVENAWRVDESKCR